MSATVAAAARLLIARPGDLHPIDEVHPATGCGRWTGRTVEEITGAHAGARLMTLAEWEPLAAAAEVAQFCKPAQEVDAERWWQMLECMYPLNWRGVGGVEESFMLAEPYTDTLRICLVRIGERYAEMVRPVSTAHAQLCDEARAILRG